MREVLAVNDVLMVPKYGRLSSRSDAILKPFLYSAPMDTVTGYEFTKEMLRLGEFPVVCRFLKSDWERSFREFHSDPRCFFAVGDNAGLWDLLGTIPLEYGSKVSFAVDVAHGHSVVARDLLKRLKQKSFVGSLMSGSIATGAAALDNVAWGATHLRVGVGPGSLCQTREKTGVGVSQFSAVQDIHTTLVHAGLRHKVTVIADGGIKTPGDALKYLGAGADAVMMGRTFCTTDESAGWRKDSSGVTVKSYRGQASAEFQQDHFGQKNRCPEGASSRKLFPTGPLEEVVEEFRGGAASAISYLGLVSLEELCPENVEFVRVTPAGWFEGTPHGV